MGILCKFLKLLFQYAEQNRVIYCVLRNYEKLPEDTDNDVDILVHKSHLNSIEKCLGIAAKECELILVKNPRRYGFRSYCYLDNSGGSYIHIDIWSKLLWKGMSWIDEKSILQKRKKYKSFYVPEKESEIAIVLIKDLIQNGIIRQKYNQYLVESMPRYGENIVRILHWGIGEKMAKIIVDQIEANNSKMIENTAYQIRIKVIMRNLWRNPFTFVRNQIYFLFYHFISSVFNNNGLFLVLVGPDGSGKSTIADGIGRNLSILFSEKYYYHSRFGIIPDMRNVVNIFRKIFMLKKLPDNLKGINAVHGIKPYSLMNALKYVIYYNFDYILGYIIILRAKSNGSLVIFDRYYYDYMMQPQFDNIPKKILLWNLKILPKPDFVIYLKADPENINNRKPELTIDDIRKQQERITQNLCRLRQYIEVDSNKNPENTISEINKRIIEFMTIRTKK